MKQPRSRDNEAKKAKSMVEPSGSGDVFDLNKVKQLVEMMEQHGLNEVHLRRGEEQWRLRRGPREVLAAPGQALAPAAYAPAAPASAPVAAPAASAAVVNDGTIAIKSPTVGTFYASPTPEDPAFVQVGSTVSRESIVCIIEAMKVFNQIPAEVSGTITQLLVQNGDPVEFGQPLFKVKP